MWDSILCDTSPNSVCWRAECGTCSNARFVPQKPYGSNVNLKQWEIFLTPKNTSYDNDKSHESEANPKNFSKQLQLINRDMSVGDVFDMLAASFKSVVIHVNTKRMQVSEFQRDKEDPLKLTLQIDYAMAYQCMYQDKLQEALWSRQPVNLFTCALTHKCSTNTMLIWTDVKGQVFLWDLLGVLV